MRRGCAAARQMLEQALAPQAGEHGLGDERAVASAEPRVIAEEGSEHGVGRLAERQHRGQRGHRPRELRRLEISHERAGWR